MRTCSGAMVFEVGKEQFWTWTEHMGRFDRTNLSYPARVWVMDGVSLARGRYVIVSMMVRSDGRASTPLVCDSFRSKRKALGTLDAYEEHQRYLLSHYGDGPTECFELWHVVDDGELWGAWQAKVEAAKSHEAAVVDFLCQLREAGELEPDSEPVAAPGEPEPDDGEVVYVCEGCGYVMPAADRSGIVDSVVDYVAQYPISPLGKSVRDAAHCCDNPSFSVFYTVDDAPGISRRRMLDFADIDAAVCCSESISHALDTSDVVLSLWDNGELRDTWNVWVTADDGAQGVA